jgi:RND family efflux transporter MFP subunit
MIAFDPIRFKGTACTCHLIQRGSLSLRRLQRKASAVILSAATGLLGVVVGCNQSDSYVAPKPPVVTVTKPIRRSVPNYKEYTGTTKAEETVDLRARVKGFLKERLFEERARVKKDQPLFVIDEEPFQVALEMARAKLDDAVAALKKAEQSKSKEVAAAQLALDQATLVLARLDERRNKALFEKNAGTREAVEQSEANRRKAEAQVLADEASLEQSNADYQTNILSAKANVDAARSDVRNAEINLGYCRINAPFDGQISRRLYDKGNLVGDGQATVLATVYKVDNIYSYVTASEADLLLFRKLSRENKRKNYLKGETIELELGLADEEGFPHRGVLDYSDPSVDPLTGTVTCRGIFANPELVILPGLFVRVRVVLEERPDALLVPERALGTDQQGRFLLIVGQAGKEKNIVEKRHVKIGVQQGELRVIEGKLHQDDLVIVRGLQMARPDTEVVPKLEDPSKSTVASVANLPQH